MAPSTPRKLTLVIHSLVGGGAERSLASLANHWTARGHEVCLITFDDASGRDYPVDAAVHRIGLNAMRDSRGVFDAVRNNYHRWRKLRRAIRDARGEIVVSFTDRTNVLTLLACWGLGIPVVVCERIDPRHHPIGRFWDRLRRWTYPRCTCAVVQTGAVGEVVRSWTRSKPVFAIPNMIERMESVSSVTAIAGKSTQIVAMGRFAPQKGFDWLIQSFAQIATRYPEWSLVILGEGPERTRLERLIRDQRLEGRIRLPGWSAEPRRVLGESAIFALSSRYEGFPNALLEAMSARLPVISFDCPSGPAEIVRHEQNGLLIPPGDVAGFAAGIERLILDAPLRARLAANGWESLRRFEPNVILPIWDRVFDFALGNGDRNENDSSNHSVRR